MSKEMVKNIELLVRRADLSQEEFIALLKRDGDAIKEVSGIKGYLINEVVPTPPRKDIKAMRLPDVVDAIIEIYYDDLESCRAVNESKAMKEWMEKRTEYVSEIKRLVALEHTVMSMPEGRLPVKNFAFLNRHVGMTHSEFIEEWIVLHGPMALGVPHLSAFMPNEVLCEMSQEGIPEADTGHIEGVAIACFESIEEEMKMLPTEQAKAWFQHGGVNFGKVRGMDSFETVVIPPEI